MTFARTYFWRSTQQQEIDFVESIGEKIYAYVFKWKAKLNFKLPKRFYQTIMRKGY